MITSHDQVIAYVGQSLKLLCKAVNVYEELVVLIWEYNGRRLAISKDSTHYINNKEVEFWYSFSSLTLENSGNYTCAVQSHRGRTKKVINLRVENNGK